MFVLTLGMLGAVQPLELRVEKRPGEVVVLVVNVSKAELEVPIHPYQDVLLVTVRSGDGGVLQGDDARHVEEPPGHPTWTRLRLAPGARVPVLTIRRMGEDLLVGPVRYRVGGTVLSEVRLDTTVAPPDAGGWRGRLGPLSFSFALEKERSSAASTR